jgi:ABC-type glycerol-3-phosphate transport system substrate-binding protein
MDGLLEKYNAFTKTQKIIFWSVTVMLIGIMVLVLVNILNRRPQPVPVDNSPIALTWRKPFFTQSDYSEIISDFKKTYPNVEIRLETVSAAEFGDGTPYYQRLVTDFANDNPPDIFSILNGNLPAMSQYMTPIDYFKGNNLAKYKESFADLALVETMQLNKVYAIASYIDNLQMYYNRNILQQSGIALPPKDWEEVKEQSKVLNRRDTRGQFNQSSIAIGTVNNNVRGKEILPVLIMQNGGIIYDRQSGNIGLGQSAGADLNTNLARSTSGEFKLNERDPNNPTLNATRFFLSFADPTSFYYSWNRQEENSEDAFVNGRLAYIIHYSYFKDTIERRNPNLRFEVAPLPQQNPNNKKTLANYFMDGMGKHLQESKNSRKRAAAEAFLVHLSSKESQQKFNSKTQRPPARKDLVEDIKQSNSNFFIRFFADGSLYADNYYRPRRCTDQLFYDMVENIQTKSIPVGEAISEAVNKYNSYKELGANILEDC